LFACFKKYSTKYWLQVSALSPCQWQSDTVVYFTYGLMRYARAKNKLPWNSNW